MYTLGINAAYHDPAACIVCDGMIIAAAEEERFTHVKHGKRPVPFSTYELPFHAIDYCLREAGITLAEIDHVAYSYDPYLLMDGNESLEYISMPMRPRKQGGLNGWEPLFIAAMVNAPGHLVDGFPHHLDTTFGSAQETQPYKWHYVPHHTAHAASAFHVSPFESAAVLTLDGRGEHATTSYHRGNGMRLEHLSQVNMPHSLGLLYEEVTDYLGFLRSSDEYKVMALASYGKPLFADQFREIIRVCGNGQFRVETGNLADRFGAARRRGGPLEKRHFDIAHSLQVVLEETVLELSDWLHRETGEQNLCMAGGVALNCVMNARVRDFGPFDRMWVQPAAGDAGTALGAAVWVDLQEREGATRTYEMCHPYLGPSYPDSEIERFLEWSRLPFEKLDNVAATTAELLVQDKIVGWFQGRMELGPRALGARSILASPLSADMQQRLNNIKDREDFRPVAPVVLEEEADKWFKGVEQSPFMLFVFDVLPGREGQIPAVRHVDGTARVQTINRMQQPLYYDLLREFNRRTGVPVLVNTSFNTRGEPIVCTPRDAIESFWTSPLDALVIGSFLLQKPDQRA